VEYIQSSSQLRHRNRRDNARIAQAFSMFRGVSRALAFLERAPERRTLRLVEEITYYRNLRREMVVIYRSRGKGEADLYGIPRALFLPAALLPRGGLRRR